MMRQRSSERGRGEESRSRIICWERERKGVNSPALEEAILSDSAKKETPAKNPTLPWKRIRRREDSGGKEKRRATVFGRGDCVPQGTATTWGGNGAHPAQNGARELVENCFTKRDRGAKK